MPMMIALIGRSDVGRVLGCSRLRSVTDTPLRSSCAKCRANDRQTSRCLPTTRIAKGTCVYEQQLKEPSFQGVIAAYRRIRSEIWPVVPRLSKSLSEQAGREVWLIPECLQRTGSFKFRGALNRMLLHAERGGGPVITASSGNHAIGMTVAAGITGTETTVVVPKGVSSAKLAQLEALGAHVLIMGDGFDQAEDLMYAYAKEHGIEIVNAFDSDVIAGHGTAALDAIKYQPDLDVLIAPVASGGLIAGCAIVMKTINPKSELIGVQTSQWPAMRESLKRGELTRVSGGETLADGLEGNATRSTLPFQVIRRDVTDVLLVNEEAIRRAIRHGLIQERLVLEGAGAATIAAMLDGQRIPGTGPVGVLLSGANCTERVMQRALGA